MPLINCPDCEKQISDRAASCIHCGCPISNAEATSTIATTIKEISKTEQTTRTCPKCQATQGFRTVSSILNNDLSLINTSSVTTGSVFNAVNGNLKEEYEEVTVTAGTQNSVLVSTIQNAIRYWSCRNPDPKKVDEFLDVFICGTCLAAIDKNDRASTLNSAAEQVFVGKKLYGSWNNFFLPVDLPNETLDQVVRHTVLNVKLYKVNKVNNRNEQMKLHVTEENTGENDGPLFYWHGGIYETWAENLIKPLTAGMKEKTKFEKNLVAKIARHEENSSKVAIQVVHTGERGIRLDLFLKTKTGFVATVVGYKDPKSEAKDYFVRHFVWNFMAALDLYAIKRMEGIPEDQIRQSFNLENV